MNWLAVLMQLLPVVILGVERVGADVQGKQKKKIATDVITSLGAGLSQVLPGEDGQAAAGAAAVAVDSIDAVVGAMKQAGVLPPSKSAAAAPAPGAAPAPAPAKVAVFPSAPSAGAAVGSGQSALEPSEQVQTDATGAALVDDFHSGSGTDEAATVKPGPGLSTVAKP
jgi:hypothetical protein